MAWDIDEDDMQSQPDETETEIDWTPQEDSAPSTDDYSSQSEEELDGIDPSNTVRYLIVFQIPPCN